MAVVSPQQFMNWNKKEIEQCIRNGMTQSEIARLMRVSRQAVSLAVIRLGLQPLAIRERARQKRIADAQRAKEKAAGKIAQARQLRESGLFKCSACGVIKPLAESAAAPENAARQRSRCKLCNREQRQRSYRKSRA